MRSVTALFFRAAVKTLFSLVTTSAGVPAGETSPNQPTDSYPSRPLSIMVGTLGKVSTRVVDETARPRSLPSRINCCEVGMSSTARGT
jgi:hypothetical protein